MAISVVKGRRLRDFGLHRIGRPERAGPSAAGDSADRKVIVPPPRPSPENNPRTFQGLYKASAPRLSGPYERLSTAHGKSALLLRSRGENAMGGWPDAGPAPRCVSGPVFERGLRAFVTIE